MFSSVFLVVASSSLFASLVLPSVFFYCFIDLLLYCYTFLLFLVVSIGFYCFFSGFQKPSKFAYPCVFCFLLCNYDLSFWKMRNSRDFKPYFSFWFLVVSSYCLVVISYWLLFKFFLSVRKTPRG